MAQDEKKIMHRTNFHFHPEFIERLRKYSKHTGMSMAEIMRRAMDKHLKEAGF